MAMVCLLTAGRSVSTAVCARVQFLAGPNLLTGNTDGHWRAVRKGVAPAFSATHMRCGF